MRVRLKADTTYVGATIISASWRCPPEPGTIGGRNLAPSWSADGQRIIFQSDRDGDVAIFWQRADGTGPAERLTKADADTAHVPESVSPDGKHLLFGKTEKGISTLQMYNFADRTTTPFGSISSALPTCATFSPDGRWVAYTASSTTVTAIHVYVQAFPPNGTTYEIAVGIHPMWSRDGKQLFYGPGQGRYASVSINTRPTFTFGNAVAVNRLLLDQGPNVQRPFDIAPDGRLIGVITAGATESDVSVTGAAPQIQVVLNWFDEVKQRVPIK